MRPFSHGYSNSADRLTLNGAREVAAENIIIYASSFTGIVGRDVHGEFTCGDRTKVERYLERQ